MVVSLLSFQWTTFWLHVLDEPVWCSDVMFCVYMKNDSFLKGKQNKIFLECCFHHINTSIYYAIFGVCCEWWSKNLNLKAKHNKFSQLCLWANFSFWTRFIIIKMESRNGLSWESMANLVLTCAPAAKHFKAAEVCVYLVKEVWI